MSFYEAETAVMTGNLASVRRLIERNPGLLKRGTRDCPAILLKFAINKPDVPMCKLLVELGSEIAPVHFKRAFDKLQGWWTTAENRDKVFEICGFLLESAMDTHTRSDAASVLKAAAKSKESAELCDLVLSKWKDTLFETQPTYCLSADRLAIACHTGGLIPGLYESCERFNLLRISNQHPFANHRRHLMIGALKAALTSLDENLVLFLLEKGAPAMGWGSGESPMALFVKQDPPSRCFYLIKLLLDHGASFYDTGCDGILKRVIKNRNEVLLEYLISLGIDLNTVDGDRNTPLYWAACGECWAGSSFRPSVEMCEILLENGAELDPMCLKKPVIEYAKNPDVKECLQRYTYLKNQVTSRRMDLLLLMAAEKESSSSSIRIGVKRAREEDP